MVQDAKIPSRKKILAPIVNVPDAPENLYLPKAEFVKRRKAMRDARKKADEAYRQAMTEQMSDENIELKNADTAVRKQRQLVATLQSQVNNIESELTEASDGEKRAIKAQMTKTKNKLEEAELKLKEVEAEYDVVKSQA